MNKVQIFVASRKWLCGGEGRKVAAAAYLTSLTFFALQSIFY